MVTAGRIVDQEKVPVEGRKCPYCGGPHISVYSARGPGHWVADCMECNARGPKDCQTMDEAIEKFCGKAGNNG